MHFAFRAVHPCIYLLLPELCLVYESCALTFYKDFAIYIRESMANAGKRAAGLTEDERAAMKERLAELNSNKNDGEKAVSEAIAKMKEPDRSMARRVHEIIRANAPGLSTRTWYGMPAYTKGDKVICFFQNAGKFKARYSVLGFSDKAGLDDGNMWPVSFALNKLTAKEEKMIAELVRRAIR